MAADIKSPPSRVEAKKGAGLMSRLDGYDWLGILAIVGWFLLVCVMAAVLATMRGSP